jgi:FtsZ-binding cell division protein ZapB
MFIYLLQLKVQEAMKKKDKLAREQEEVNKIVRRNTHSKSKASMYSHI